jgi:hypothetical protein
VCAGRPPVDDRAIRQRRIELEMTPQDFTRGYHMDEAPIPYDGRDCEDGSTITWRDGLVAPWVLLKYRFTE